MILLISFYVFFGVFVYSKETVSFNVSDSTIIVGEKLHTIWENKPYAAFWKIPYAMPPVDKLRFKAPLPNQRWRSETTYDYSYPLNETCTTSFNEDCLYLSLFTPLLDDNRLLPVIVWLHEHSNLHEPDFLIDEDVVVVRISYRTGIFGFLNTEDDFARGNMGAKDILMALKWVRDNISAFNGDVNKVSVAGSGAAANLVASILLSSAAEDLFTRVIIQSGSALSPADYRQRNFEIANKLYNNFYTPRDKFNRERLYDALSAATPAELTSASRDLFDSSEVRDSQRLINSFGPSLETSKKYAFMSKPPLEVYRRRLSNNNVDVMIGFNNLESLYKLKGLADNRKLLKYLNYNFQYLLPFEGAADEFGSKRYRNIKRRIMEFYFVNATISERSLRRYAKYASDQVIYPLLRQARLHSEVSCNDVYLYRFAMKASLNIGWSFRNLNWSGATSGDEICYLFRCKSVNDVYEDRETPERDFIKKIVRLWTNFAKFGNPTPEGRRDKILGDLKWVPLSNSKPLEAMNFGARKTKMVTLPEEKRMKFWDELKQSFFPERKFREEF